MCQAMGTTPLEHEIPMTFEELPFQLQTAFKLYGYLQDEWDYMGGNYIGKKYSDFSMIADIHGIPKEDRLIYLDFLKKIDANRSKAIVATKPKK